ncbi:MAG: DUF542 domain-containing protein, partial [Planctomycetota bacterium]
MITSQDTLAHLAAVHPWASKVFQKFNLDYCCQGSRSVEKACQQSGIDASAVLEELQREEVNHSGPAVNWDQVADGEILEHITHHYHESHRKELPRLIHMADKVESVHKGKPGVPKGLGELLRELFLDLEKHMAEEEERVFPAIRRQQDGLTSALKALSADHESAGRVLHHFDLMTSDCVPPH